MDFNLKKEQNNSLEGTLLSELLAGKDDSFKAKILDLVARHGLDHDDPLFHFLIVTDYLQSAYEEAPIVLEQTFVHHKALLDRAVDGATQTAIKTQTDSIRTLVEKILKETSALQLKNPKNVTLGFALFAFVFALGVATGIGAYLGLGQFFLSGYKITTNKQALSLAWAESEEGKYARNLYEWNKKYIESGRCIAEIKKEGIRLKMNGQEITEGICTLFIQPPPN